MTIIFRLNFLFISTQDTFKAHRCEHYQTSLVFVVVVEVKKQRIVEGAMP
jgi:hypothetical protein